jgi:hypothetical protein
MDREEARVDVASSSTLRLLGFVGVTVGGLLIGIGATSNWAVVGLTSDPRHVLDSPIKGTDVWEGKVTLALALIVVLGIIAMRVASSDPMRKAIACLIVVSGVSSAGIGLVDAVKFTERFSGGSGALAAIAQSSSAKLGVPASKLMQDLLANRSKLISVTHGPGLWLVIGGGVLAAIGGILSMSWTNTQTA